MEVIEFQVRLPFAVKRERGFFVARTPALDVYSQGPTKEKAVKNLIEAIQLFLESCFERGTLGAVMKEQGFSPAPRRIAAPEQDEMIDVPLPFMVQSDKDKERCRA